jgi:hypothetical protein
MNHPIFTDFTWSDLGNSGLTRETGRDLSWTKQHDLAVQAYELQQGSELTFESWRELVSAICSGLPVIATWQHGGETTTATILLEQLLGMNWTNSAIVYHRRWGFAGPIRVNDLVSVKAPEASYAHA